MWLYPVPSLVAVSGWLYILIAQREYLLPALVVLVSGILVYPLWRWIQSRQTPGPGAAIA
jgi:hypothetical protein